VIAYIIQGIGYGFAAAVQPGAFQTYIFSQTLERGWRRTLPSALAPLVSDGLVIALVLLVLSQVPPWFQSGLCFAGGLFVLYLAYGSFVAWRGRTTVADIEDGPRRQSLLKAAIMNLLSPGPYVYWSLVAGPILLAGWRLAPANGLGFLLGFYGTMIATLGGLILLFGTARRLGPKVNHALLGISALALTVFGLYQLWLGVSGLSGG
jgi:threonine/homoserine/homoserine lactone efflux protein